MATLIRAAGGVLWRGAEVCIVHRPRYDDWSLPKGKLNAREHPLAAGVREVWEETGVRGAPQVRLHPVHYLVREGLPKTVDFWSMRVLDEGVFKPSDEVDGLGWMPVAEAIETVSYPHDAGVLRQFAALPQVTGLVLLIRHGDAGERDLWNGPDIARPLTAAGQEHAEKLAALLAFYAPTRLVAASPRRCSQTVAPLAATLGLPIEVDKTFDEPDDAAVANPVGPGARLRELASAGGVTVVCSQRKVIPPTLAWLTDGDPESYATARGSGWVLPFANTVLLGTEPIAP